VAILYSVISFAVIISFIVFIHEFGHYYIARRAGVRIEVFSIGMGKVLWHRFDKYGTKWQIAILPIGGYVKMFGDQNIASTGAESGISEEEKRYTLEGQTLGWRAAIVAAGPIANYLLAIIILTLLFWGRGQIHIPTVIEHLIENSPAEQAGLKPGDRIVNIDDKKIENMSQLQQYMQLHRPERVTVTVNREGEELKVEITPKEEIVDDGLGNKASTKLLGVVMHNSSEHRDYNILEAFGAAVKTSYDLSAATLEAIGQMISGKRGTEELGGVIRIAKYSGQTARISWLASLWFIAVLSLNLGLMNLLPLPVLDGGHLFFYLLEAIKGKPVDIKWQMQANKIGIAILLLLMIFSTVNDIIHF